MTYTLAQVHTRAHTFENTPLKSETCFGMKLHIILDVPAV